MGLIEEITMFGSMLTILVLAIQLIINVLIVRGILIHERDFKRELTQRRPNIRLRLTLLWPQIFALTAPPVLGIIAYFVGWDLSLISVGWLVYMFSLLLAIWFPLSRPYFVIPVAAMIASRLKQELINDLKKKGETSIVLTNLLVRSSRRNLLKALSEAFPNVKVLSGRMSMRNPLDVTLIKVQQWRARGLTALAPLVYVLACMKCGLSLLRELPRPIGSVTAEVDLATLQTLLPRSFFQRRHEFLHDFMRGFLVEGRLSPFELKDFKLHIVMIPIRSTRDDPSTIYAEDEVILWDASNTHLEVKAYRPNIIVSTTQLLYYLMHIKGATVTFDYGQALLAGFFSLLYSRVRGDINFNWFKRKPGTSKIIEVEWNGLQTSLNLADFDWESRKGLAKWAFFVRLPPCCKSQPKLGAKSMVVKNELEVRVGPDWYYIPAHPSQAYRFRDDIDAWETFLREGSFIFTAYRLYDASWIESKKWDILTDLYKC